MGRWCVIASTPYFGERSNVGSYAEWSLWPDGRIDDAYAYRPGSFDAPFKCMQFVDPVMDGSGGGEWRVRLFWPIYVSQPTLYVDPEYRVTLPGYPGKSLGWAFSREPNMSDADYRAALGRFEAMGHDTSCFWRVPQFPSQVGQPGFQPPGDPNQLSAHQRDLPRRRRRKDGARVPGANQVSKGACAKAGSFASVVSCSFVQKRAPRPGTYIPHKMPPGLTLGKAGAMARCYCTSMSLGGVGLWSHWISSMAVSMGQLRSIARRYVTPSVRSASQLGGSLALHNCASYRQNPSRHSIPLPGSCGAGMVSRQSTQAPALMMEDRTRTRARAARTRLTGILRGRAYD